MVYHIRSIPYLFCRNDDISQEYGNLRRVRVFRRPRVIRAAGSRLGTISQRGYRTQNKKRKYVLHTQITPFKELWLGSTVSMYPETGKLG